MLDKFRKIRTGLDNKFCMELENVAVDITYSKKVSFKYQNVNLFNGFFNLVTKSQRLI